MISPRAASTLSLDVIGRFEGDAVLRASDRLADHPEFRRDRAIIKRDRLIEQNGVQPSVSQVRKGIAFLFIGPRADRRLARQHSFRQRILDRSDRMAAQRSEAVQSPTVAPHNDPFARHVIRAREQHRRPMLGRHFDAVENHLVQSALQPGNETVPIVLDETRPFMKPLRDGRRDVVFETFHMGGIGGVMKNIRHIRLPVGCPDHLRHGFGHNRRRIGRGDSQHEHAARQ